MGRSLVKCLLWGLIVLVHLHGHRGCFEEERMGLLEIKEEFARSTPNATIRDHLPPSLARAYILPSWVDDYKSECCEWERVTCNSTTGHVTHLSLQNIWEFDTEGPYYYFLYTSDFKDMVWFLNVSLFESLKELRSLDLSYNAIGGWIEHKGSESLLRLNKLESLDLDANNFNRSIIQSLRLLTSLKSLNLSKNALEGSLPTKELSVFEDLEVLDLRDNRLNGSETVQESGLEKLAVGHGAMPGLGFRGIRVEKGLGLEHLSPTASHPMGWVSSDLIRGPLRWDGSPLPDSLTSSFIPACVRCPSSTCRVNFYKTDICPISPIPELLEMVDKAEEYGSVRKHTGLQGIPFDLLMTRSCRLAVQDAPLLTSLYEAHLRPAAHLMRWGSGTDTSLLFRFFWKPE
uniref:Leucine-rich repeat-containing N-terminal plant-type domain-containing protein n=1 Tax=Quercus lobata TaxID=97700 RepID=A0A7N2LUQ8_QUELO